MHALAQTAGRSDFIPALTGVRGLAALMVFGFHLHHLVAPFPPLARGFLGVDVFFALSGFLLAWLAGNASAVDWVDFGKRRLLRIFPALYAQMLVLGVLVGTVSWTWLFPWPGATAYAAQFGLLFHLGATPMQPLVGPWWSIPVELGFYALFPLLWFGLRRQLMLTLVVVLAVVWGYRSWLLLNSATSPWLSAWLGLLPGRLEQFALGMVAAMVLRRTGGVPAGQRLGWFVAAVTLCLIPLVWPQLSQAQVHWPWGVVLNSVFAAGLAGLLFMLCSADSPASRILSWSPLRGLGVVSYGFYLWHVPAMMAVRHHLDPAVDAWLRQSAAFALSLALATLSWLVIERPFQRWVHRHSVKRSP